MENVPKLNCACTNCGLLVEYSPEDIGQSVACPKCKEKFLLPEPSPLELAEATARAKISACPVCASPMPPYGSICENCKSRRRRTLGLIAGIASAIVLLGIGWLFLKKFYTPKKSPPPVNAILRPPRVNTPKSARDFKIGQFWLESNRGSSLSVAAGDISNASLNVYLHLQADADLLDARGTKIGSVSDQINELLPNKTWRFIAKVTDPRAKSVRFGSIKEIQ